MQQRTRENPDQTFGFQGEKSVIVQPQVKNNINPFYQP